MAVTGILSACNGQNSDVHCGLPNVTPGTSATTIMDQKELEDRLAAAEALSSLAQVGVEEEVLNLKAPRGRSRGGRGGRDRVGRAQEGSGRKSKSRSSRGRGGGGRNAALHVGDGSSTVISTTTATTAAQALTTADGDTLVQRDTGLPSPATLTCVGTTSTTIPNPKRSGRGRGGGSGVKQGTKRTPTLHQTDFDSLTGNKTEQERRNLVAVHQPRACPRDSVVISTTDLESSTSLSQADTSRGPNVQLQVVDSALRHQQQDMVQQVHSHNANTSSNDILAATTPVTSSVTGLFTTMAQVSTGGRNISSSSLALSFASGVPFISQVSAINPATATSPAAAVTSGNLPIQQAFSSAQRLDSLPLPSLSLRSMGLGSVNLGSIGLGSINLSSLPSIPNLPSLPSSLASLQLNAGSGTASSLSMANDVTPGSQLSPLNRENDEKSLPLKKRRIVEASTLPSASLSALLPQAGLASLSASVPQAGLASLTSPTFPLVSGSSPSSLGTSAPNLAANSARVPSRGSNDDSPPCTPPPPVSHVVGMLQPNVAMQLISEIHTSIKADEDGDVPLHIAVVHENEAMVKKLIQLMALAGQRVDRYNKQHQTPLHLAVKLQSLVSIQMLLQAGADQNLVDSMGLTSVHMAVQRRDIDCVEALLQWSTYPCDLNYRNFEGMAPIHTAVMNNDLEIVHLLLEHGADVNIMDGKSGRTVLFHAAETNQKTAVELLLNHGADPEIANYAGVVPAMAAQGRSHTAVARLLARAVEEDTTSGENCKTKTEPNPEAEERSEGKCQKQTMVARLLSRGSEDEVSADKSRGAAMEPDHHSNAEIQQSP